MENDAFRLDVKGGRVGGERWAPRFLVQSAASSSWAMPARKLRMTPSDCGRVWASWAATVTASSSSAVTRRSMLESLVSRASEFGLGRRVLLRCVGGW